MREGIEFSTAAGRMLAGVSAALAGYERELRHERAEAAGEAARLTLRDAATGGSACDLSGRWSGSRTAIWSTSTSVAHPVRVRHTWTALEQKEASVIIHFVASQTCFGPAALLVVRGDSPHDAAHGSYDVGHGNAGPAQPGSTV